MYEVFYLCNFFQDPSRFLRSFENCFFISCNLLNSRFIVILLLLLLLVNKTTMKIWEGNKEKPPSISRYCSSARFFLSAFCCCCFCCCFFSRLCKYTFWWEGGVQAALCAGNGCLPVALFFWFFWITPRGRGNIWKDLRWYLNHRSCILKHWGESVCVCCQHSTLIHSKQGAKRGNVTLLFRQKRVKICYL